MSLLEALGEDPSCLFQLLVAPGVPWLVAASFQFASVFAWPSPLHSLCLLVYALEGQRHGI